MTEGETFLEALKRVMDAEIGKLKDLEMARKRRAAKWNPETLRAVAFRISCANRVVDHSEVVEALDAAADAVEKAQESVKWAYIRAMRRAK